MKRMFLILLLFAANAFGASNFALDPNCKALWRHEDGALGTDSVGSNTLTNDGVSSSATCMEGSYSGYYDRDASDQQFRIDSALDAGFPLKNGDTNKRISVCLWYRYDHHANNQYYSMFMKSGANERSFWFWHNRDGSGDDYIGIYIGYNAGADWELLTTSAIADVEDDWLHIGVTYQDSDKSWKLRVWDDTAGSVAINASGTATNNINVEDGGVRLGCYHDTINHEMEGYLDEVVVFNDILTTDEIDDIRGGTYMANSPTGGVSRPLLFGSY